MKSKIWRINFLISGCMALLMGLMSVTAQAADLTPAQIVINESAQKLKTKLSDRSEALSFAEASAIVEELIDPNVDFDRMSAFVLGKHWRTASDDQKTRFKQEFRNMLIRTYATAYTEFTDWSIRFLPMKPSESEDKVMVKSEILQPGRPPVSVDYRMVDHGGDNWKVYDVVIEGISLVANYRTSFRNDIARSGSLETVIEQLSKRNQEAMAKNGKDEPEEEVVQAQEG